MYYEFKKVIETRQFLLFLAKAKDNNTKVVINVIKTVDIQEMNEVEEKGKDLKEKISPLLLR